MQNEIGDQTHPEDVGSIQSFPELTRDANGKLTPDSVAALAIQGMLPGRVAEEAERLETQYQQWINARPEFDPRGLWNSLTLRLAMPLMEEIAALQGTWTGKGIEILRRQIALLALNFQESQNDLKALTIRTEFYQQYVKMVEDNTKFRAFLYENFPEELKLADATNMPLMQFAQGLMLQLKSKQ